MRAGCQASSPISLPFELETNAKLVIERISTDVLVIGAGAAGIRAAVAASENNADVTILAKRPVGLSGSTFSPISRGWGIQVLLGEERTHKGLEDFYTDVTEVGLGRCNPRLVRVLAEESGPRFEDLISYGVNFRRGPDGRYIRRNGCFSASKRAFITESFENINWAFRSVLWRLRVRTISAHVTDLIVVDGTCWGAWALNDDGRALEVQAKSTILASGGGAAVFEDHVVNPSQIGDGYCLAHRAGARLGNLEFIQFVLGLKENGNRRLLSLSDVSRPGALQDARNRDLLEAVHPDPEKRAEIIEKRRTHVPFSSRDASSRVDIVVSETRQNDEKIFWRPQGCQNDGEPREVVHCAHAFNGGVEINEKGETTISGLFAAGEVAAGPHGADRIGGCMMTATQVFGKRAGEFAAQRSKAINRVDLPRLKPDRDMTPVSHPLDHDDKGAGSEVLQTVRRAMGRYAMVLRSRDGLTECRKTLFDCESWVLEMIPRTDVSPKRHLELRNVILTAKLVVESALLREQSLGAHLRTDVPGSGTGT